ncbi:MAG TPA: trypsin-like peptidase domain-containing protein [Burkholderiaceae bacterium]|nr:trypsin-like peptidase domain-containing protein [Burkholderiaceae bacterium]
MRRPSLYSRSSGSRPRRDPEPGAQTQPSQSAAPGRTGLRAWLGRFERPLLVALGALAALGLVAMYAQMAPKVRVFTQRDIDQAVLHTLSTKSLPSAEARAFENIRRSVVRVRNMAPRVDGGPPYEQGVGSGVVIVDSGVILTNLHVVSDAQFLRVVFFDGLESEAVVITKQPENDLAVLRAKTIPDDLPAATLRSTGDLAPGDHVVAVGFPFGIGPSVTAGVISGLRREFRSTNGDRVLTNLIQFDAAANPGSSGGPLVTLDGEVVGIVTAILNPTQDRFFVGVGFAVPIENAATAMGIHPF